MTHTADFLLLLLSYLFGSLPIGLMVGRMVKGIDVRDYGSGNIGASNVWRTMGPLWGIVVFLFDFCKGLFPVGMVEGLFSPQNIPVHSVWLPIGAGLAAIAGHNFSPFLKFKGGKGVATSLGVVYGLAPGAAAIGFAVWGLCLLITRYISLSSMIRAVVTSAVLIYRHPDLPHILFASLVTLSVHCQAPFQRGPDQGRHRAEGRTPRPSSQAHRPTDHCRRWFPMTDTPPRLILASTSPRRRELLALLGLPFEVVASRFDEAAVSPGSMTPSDYVTHLAHGKALEVAARTDGDALVIGADTTVALDSQFLNKPADAQDARRMLRALSGRTHQVYTGLCLIAVQDSIAGEPTRAFAVTDVTFDTLTEAIIAAYVGTGEPLDKAGAYGIQGKALSFIPRIKGDYFNVVGMPLEYLRKLLLPFFPDIASAPPPPLLPDPIYGV